MGVFTCYRILFVSIVALLPTISYAVVCDDFDLQGIFVPVVTPAYDNGTIRVDIIYQYAVYLKDNGIDGVVVASTAGEGPNLNVSDNKLILDAWMAAAPSVGLYVISDIGATPLPDTLEMATYSEELGVDAILATPEVYYRAQNADELVDYLRYIYEAAPSTPLLYEHFPQYSRVDVDMEEFFDLATDKIPTFKGVKSDVFETSLLLQNKVRDDQRIFVGDYEAVLAAQALLGFQGYVVAVANLFPSLVVDEVSVGQNGDINQTRSLNQRLDELRSAVFEGDAIAALKEVTYIISGLELGPVFPPLMPLTEEQKSDLRANLEELGVPIVG